MRSVVSSSFSLLELHCPKEIRGQVSPSGKNYEKTEASESTTKGKLNWTEHQAGRNLKTHPSHK